MEFTKSLIKGKLIKRYKRFFVDVKLDTKIVTAHCPNTGSMKGLLDRGNEVYLIPNNDPKRKLKYTLEIGLFEILKDIKLLQVEFVVLYKELDFVFF